MVPLSTVFFKKHSFEHTSRDAIHVGEFLVSACLDSDECFQSVRPLNMTPVVVQHAVFLLIAKHVFLLSHQFLLKTRSSHLGDGLSGIKLCLEIHGYIHASRLVD